jgi:hypothetical protein
MKIFGLILITLSAVVLCIDFLDGYAAARVCPEGHVYDSGMSQCVLVKDYVAHFNWALAGSLLVLLLGITVFVIGIRRAK